MHLLACDGAQDLAQGVARELGLPLLQRKETWFSCGEGKLIVQQNVRGSHVYVFQQPIVPGSSRSVYDRLMMLLHACEACTLADASSVTAVLPYYPTARQDRRLARTREGIHAGLVARMLEAAGVRRVVTVEIHNEAIAGMFHPARCRLENVYVSAWLAPWLRAKGLCGDTVVSPDVGGLKRARRFASILESDLAALSKERDYSQPGTVNRSSLLGSVDGQDVLLIDDIVDTGGSVVAAIDELRANGAVNVTVACAHPLLSGPAWDRMSAMHARSVDEGWRFRLVGTSSVCHADAPDWYLEFALEPLLAKVLRNMHAGGSVTQVQESSP
jgi:ribose-phosphate pyrophosphokinase